MKTATENIINTLSGKKVLFLENDSSLYDGVDEFRRVLDSAKIKNDVIFNLSEQDFNYIKKRIHESDVIVFMTQWVSDVSHNLLSWFKTIKDKKIVVEVFIDEPTFFYKRRHGTKHDLYIYTCLMGIDGTAEKDTEEFYKITNKPYWDYKNKFDK